MNPLLFLGVAVLVGAVLSTHALASALLGLLASFCVSCARDGSGNTNSTGSNSNDTSTTEPVKSGVSAHEQVVTCYRRVSTSIDLFSNSDWNSIQELTRWAKAERVLLAYSHATNLDDRRLTILVNDACKSSSDARILVDKNILSKAVYDTCYEIMDDWHRALATKSGQMTCYMTAKRVNPEIADDEYWLWQIEDLKDKAQIDLETVMQAKESLRNSISKTLSEKDTRQLLELLDGLLNLK